LPTPETKWHDASRAAWIATVAFGAALFWIAPRPPMGDLPQHAAQVAMLGDLLHGGSRWSELVEINWRTPYLVGCAFATALSFVMPVVAALKTVLTVAYVGFAFAGVALRKELGADARLDWLWLPGFFGLSFDYGFLPYLVAAPVGLVFLRQATRAARTPDWREAARVVAVGVLLYFSHGLVFVFAVAVAVVMVILRRELSVRALAPYAVLAIVAIAVFVDARLHHPLLAHGEARIDFEWDKPGGWHRAFAFLAYVVASTPRDLAFVPVVLAMLAAPLVLRDGISRDRAALAPLAVVVFAWLFVPSEIAKTTYLYQRFALFLLPAWALAFRAGDTTRVRAELVEAALALACIAFFGGIALRERRFARESAPFESVLAAAEPDQRALALILDARSDATKHAWAYHAWPAWYQVDRGGFVDFNFAALPPEMVRFRAGAAPPLAADVDVTTPAWRSLDLAPYRYVFVRHEGPIPPGTLEACAALVRSEGDWSLFERRCPH
jgi:hypothetical protein